MEAELKEIKETLYEIKLSLNEHIRRTEIAEEGIKLLRVRLEPVEKAYVGIKWSIGLLIAAGGIAAALSRLM